MQAYLHHSDDVTTIRWSRRICRRIAHDRCERVPVQKKIIMEKMATKEWRAHKTHNVRANSAMAFMTMRPLFHFFTPNAIFFFFLSVHIRVIRISRSCPQCASAHAHTWHHRVHWSRMCANKQIIMPSVRRTGEINLISRVSTTSTSPAHLVPRCVAVNWRWQRASANA